MLNVWSFYEVFLQAGVLLNSYEGEKDGTKGAERKESLERPERQTEWTLFRIE